MLKALFSVLGVIAVTIGFLLSTTLANPVGVGQDAPKITATTQDGMLIDLGETYKKGLTLVYFYPKADTPGCTKEACSLRDSFAKLTEKGVTVIGVSMDKPEDQKAFKAKYKLPFTLVADEKGEVVKQFGVPMVRLGFASRQSFLVDKNGKIVWRDLEASTDKQAEDVLKAVDGLKK
jgi:peroxiredoxin Q/BCP